MCDRLMLSSLVPVLRLPPSGRRLQARYFLSLSPKISLAHNCRHTETHNSAPGVVEHAVDGVIVDIVTVLLIIRYFNPQSLNLIKSGSMC